MKLAIFIFSIFIWSCHSDPKSGHIVWDSVAVASLPNTSPSTDTVAILSDVRPADTSGCKQTIDSLRTALFLEKFKVTKVRKYLKICIHNPSQDKFLKGWIKRAIQ